MSDLKIKLFSILNSIGPSMSAQQSEDISEAFNELDRLRAEVASLKEQLQNVDVLASSLHHDKESLTQQLAAAMRRVERLVAAATPVLRNELDKVEVHPCDYNDDAARARQCTAEVQELLAALTALPQQVKSEDARDAERMDWIQSEVETGGMFALEKFGGSWVKLFTASTQHMKQKPSVRAAIDAAISVQEEKS